LLIFSLLSTPFSRFIERAAADKPEKLEKHRFLVQTKIIGDEDFERIVVIPLAERMEEVISLSLFSLSLFLSVSLSLSLNGLMSYDLLHFMLKII
jgi:hypothetical protein